MMYSNTSNPVSPSDVSLREFMMSVNTNLIWPFAGIDGVNTIARVMVITATALNLALLMPPANQGAIGYTTIVINIGTDSFAITDNAGNVIDNAAPGQVKVVVLRTNLTVAGTWLSYTLGATTSGANAALLAGLGLRAIGSTLNSDQPTNVFNVNTEFSINSRAQFNLWQGGAGVATFDVASVLGNGWWTSFRNDGTGALVLTPVNPSEIDDDPIETLNPGDSCLVFCTGSEFYSVGLGRSISITDTQTNVNVTGSANVTLTPTEYANNIINFIGNIEANINVFFPTAVKNYWLRNSTTGAFTLTATTVSGTGIAIPQGGAAVATCDGTNIDAGNTSAGGTVTSITAGTGLSGGTISNSGTISITPTGVSAGTYGDVNDIPVLVVNSQGQINNATTVPAFPTGVSMDYWGTTAPVGWLLASGLTIGNASSNATSRANADTLNLFILLWNSTTSSQLVLYNSTGTPVTRGANATADYTANCAISLPDLRGRVTAGQDNMGGTAANRITNTDGVVGTTLASSGGEETHLLVTAELASHTHTATVNDPGHTHVSAPYAQGAGSSGATNGHYWSDTNTFTPYLTNPLTGTATTGISVTNANNGSDTPHNNLQPTIIVNKIIKL